MQRVPILRKPQSQVVPILEASSAMQAMCRTERGPKDDSLPGERVINSPHQVVAGLGLTSGEETAILARVDAWMQTGELFVVKQRAYYDIKGLLPDDPRRQRELLRRVKLLWQSQYRDIVHKPLSPQLGRKNLFKAMPQQPPGGGWAPIPHGMHGGFRRPHGSGWEYWYPGMGIQKQPHSQEQGKITVGQKVTIKAKPVEQQPVQKEPASQKHDPLPPAGTWDWDRIGDPAKGTLTGYEATGEMKGRAKLEIRKVGPRGRKENYLIFDGKEYPMPKKARFDHAEGKMVELAGVAPKPGAPPQEQGKTKVIVGEKLTTPAKAAESQPAPKKSKEAGAQQKKEAPQRGAEEAREASAESHGPEDLHAMMQKAIAAYGADAVKAAALDVGKKIASEADKQLKTGAEKLADNKTVQEIVQKQFNNIPENIPKKPTRKQVESTAKALGKDPEVKKLAHEELAGIAKNIEEHAANVIAEKAGKKSKFRAIARAVLKGGAGSFVFGFIDNFVLYIAGASIDKGIAAMGVSAAVVAGLGNAVSDAVGQAGAKQVENVLDKLGLGESETEGVLVEKTEKRIKSVASIAGVFVGALAGMVPLLFGVSFGKSLKTARGRLLLQKGFTLDLRPELVYIGIEEELEKSGPYIGPKGGKWADPQHKIPWKPTKATLQTFDLTKLKKPSKAAVDAAIPAIKAWINDGHTFSEYISPDRWQIRFKASKILTQLLSKKDPEIGDTIIAWRATNRKAESDDVKSGKQIISIDHSTGKREQGMSVATGLHYAARGYKYVYRVQGKVVGFGEDGEPVLANQIVLGPRKSATKAVAADRDRKLQRSTLIYLAEKTGTDLALLSQLMYMYKSESDDIFSEPLYKGVKHKYLRRLPRKNPPQKWTYLYKHPTRQGLSTDESLRSGAKFKVEHDGKHGHFEVVRHHKEKGIVSVKHDESGRTANLKTHDLHRMLASYHQKQGTIKQQGKPKKEKTQAVPLKLHVQETQVETKTLLTAKPKPTKAAPKPQDVEFQSLGAGEWEEIIGLAPSREGAEALAANKSEKGKEYAVVQQPVGFLLVSRETNPPPAEDGAKGDPIEVIVKGEKGKGIQDIKAEYVVIEADDLIASHNPISFAKHPSYPVGVQERMYHERQTEKMKILDIAQNIDPRMVVNTNADGINGTPVITEDGIVLGGNGRTMGMQRAYEQHPASAKKLKTYIMARAHDFGVSPLQVRAMKKPILVRRIEGGHDVKRLRMISRKLNESLTQGMDPRTEEVTLAKNYVNEGLVDVLVHGIEADETLNAFFLSGRSRDFTVALEQAGIIDQFNRDKYIDPGTGLLNEEGRTRTERILAASVIPNSTVLNTMQPSTRQNIAKSVPYIMKAKANGWDITEPLVLAAKADVNRIKDGIKTTDQYLRQVSAFDPDALTTKVQKDPIATMLFRVLVEHNKPKVMPASFRQFAKRAQFQKEGEGGTGLGLVMFATPKETLQEALDGSFGISDLGKQQKRGKKEQARAELEALATDRGTTVKQLKKKVAGGGS